MKKGESNGKQPSHRSEKHEAEFNFGYFYRTIEEQFDAFAGQEGCPYSLTDIALRVGALLEAKALRAELGHPKLVSNLRGAATEGSAAGTPEDVDVAARSNGALKKKRRLNRKAIAAIAKAQRKRWRLQKQAARANKPRKTGTPVTCKLCNTKLPNRSEYMKHRAAQHPEALAKQQAALRRAVRARMAA